MQMPVFVLKACDTSITVCLLDLVAIVAMADLLCIILTASCITHMTACMYLSEMLRVGICMMSYLVCPVCRVGV